MVETQCVLCGKKQKIQELFKENFSVKQIKASTFSARRTPDRIHYRFVKCLNCETIFSNPILPKSKIARLYSKSNFHYGLESNFLKKTYGYYLQKVLDKTPYKSIRLLDIGCGNGFFLEEVKKMGIESVYGIEPGRASVKKAPVWLRKNIKVGVLKDGVFKKNMFNIITCFHTLDHIIDPNRFLKDSYRLLRKKGKVLFIVHDTNGLSVRLFGEKSPIFDIEHVYLFNKKNLTELFEKNNYSVIQIFDIQNRYPLIYWTRMLPLPKVLKKNVLQLLQFLNIDKLPLSLNAGNIGIIAEKI